MQKPINNSVVTANAQDFAVRLEHESRLLGFTLFGIAPATTPTGFHQLVNWIESGYAADMTYFRDRLDAYENLNLVLDGVRSVVMLGFPYRTESPIEPQAGQGRVARYAWGSADYHDLLHERLKLLKSIVSEAFPDALARGVVDSAPVMEREFAVLAGLGWKGKNSLLLNRNQGSYFFLCALLLTVPMGTESVLETDHCGTCTRCLDACPTQAFVSPGVLDSRRCISYQTIENRGTIPTELRVSIGNWVFGCDVCQEVCPWNRFGDASREEKLSPIASSNPIDLIELISLDEEQFRKRFKQTPLWRPRRRGLLRNAAICLGNVGDAASVEPLIRLLADPEPIVRGAAAWALGQIASREQAPGATEALMLRQQIETDDVVKSEIHTALASGKPS